MEHNYVDDYIRMGKVVMDAEDRYTEASRRLRSISERVMLCWLHGSEVTMEMNIEMAEAEADEIRRANDLRMYTSAYNGARMQALSEVAWKLRSKEADNEGR